MQVCIPWTQCSIIIKAIKVVFSKFKTKNTIAIRFQPKIHQINGSEDWSWSIFVPLTRGCFLINVFWMVDGKPQKRTAEQRWSLTSSIFSNQLWTVRTVRAELGVIVAACKLIGGSVHFMPQAHNIYAVIRSRLRSWHYEASWALINIS